MSRMVVLLALAGFCMMSGQILAEEAATPPPASAAPGDDGRYSFHRAGDGFLRLDSRTGQVSQCGWSSTGWACKLVPDERTALESEIARLQRDNAAMKKSLLSNNIELPNVMVAETAPPSAAAPVPPFNVPDPSAREPRMPSDAELDRAFAFMKNVWRRLVDMMVDLQRDMKKS
jgi:hypothetical protein